MDLSRMHLKASDLVEDITAMKEEVQLLERSKKDTKESKARLATLRELYTRLLEQIKYTDI